MADAKDCNEYVEQPMSTLADLSPDFDQAERFLTQLDPSGVFTFQTFYEAPDKDRSNSRLARVLHGTLAEHASSLIELNRQGAGVFVMVNEGDGITRPGKRTCRTTDNVTRVRAVFVDLDGAPLEPAMTATRKPHIVVESSPSKWHVYYLISNCPVERFKPVQRALAARFGGDRSVSDLARVMRMPGFLHQKGEPFMTRLAMEYARN